MTMRLRLTPGVHDRVSFGWSAGHEAIRSLQVLSGVRRYPLHVSWALRIRSQLTPGLKQAADEFGFWFRGRPLTFRDIWPFEDLRDWASDLEALRAAAIEQFAEPLIHGALATKNLGPRYELGSFQSDPEWQKRATARVLAGHPASLPVTQQLADDAEACRARFADFLELYWDTCIAADWPSMQAQLQQDIARRGRALSRRGLVSMLTELSPHIRLHRLPVRS